MTPEQQARALAAKAAQDAASVVGRMDATDLVLANMTPQSYKEKIIEVGSGKTFATVTAAINSISDNTFNKRYKIKMFPGTYAERIVLKPFIGVEGVNRETVIFNWDRPLTTPDSDVSGQSMVELHDDGCYIRNITISGTNFRYMVHTEFSSNSDRSVIIDNCHIEHNGNDASYTWANPHAWGVGLGVNNTRITITNSRLIGFTNGRAMLVHDNAAPTGSSTVIAENNIFLSDGGTIYGAVNLDNFASYTGTIPWYVKFNNNYVQSAIDTTTTSNPQRCRITGGGNSMLRYYSADWIDSSAGYVIKNNSGSTISNGTAVEVSDNRREIFAVMNGTSYNKYARFLGFAIEDIPNGSYGRVCFKGSIATLFNGVANYLDELMLDTNGQLIKYDATTAGRRPVIAQYIQPASSTVGSRRDIQLRESIKDVLSSHILTKGSNVASFAWGGTPVNTPSFIGQFAIDTVNGNVWFAKGTTATTDWVKLSN
jgi:hypothetical protein